MRLMFTSWTMARRMALASQSRKSTRGSKVRHLRGREMATRSPTKANAMPKG